MTPEITRHSALALVAGIGKSLAAVEKRAGVCPAGQILNLQFSFLNSQSAFGLAAFRPKQHLDKRSSRFARSPGWACRRTSFDWLRVGRRRALVRQTSQLPGTRVAQNLLAPGGGASNFCAVRRRIGEKSQHFRAGISFAYGVTVTYQAESQSCLSATNLTPTDPAGAL